MLSLQAARRDLVILLRDFLFLMLIHLAKVFEERLLAEPTIITFLAVSECVSLVGGDFTFGIIHFGLIVFDIVRVLLLHNFMDVLDLEFETLLVCDLFHALTVKLSFARHLALNVEIVALLGQIKYAHFELDVVHHLQEPIIVLIAAIVRVDILHLV